MDVGDEHEQAGEVLAALHDAELGSLLDRVDGVAAGIGKPDNLGARGLRLQQVGGEILRVKRTPSRAPSTLPPLAFTTAAGVALKGLRRKHSRR